MLVANEPKASEQEGAEREQAKGELPMADGEPLWPEV